MCILFKYLFLMILLTHYTKFSFHIKNVTRAWIRKFYLHSNINKNKNKEILHIENSKTNTNSGHKIVNKKKNKNLLNQENETYIIQNEFLQNKRLISISPGGFKGFYLFGVLSFIKENYYLEDFIYSGASAGAWNALFMCLNNTDDSFLKTFIQDEDLKKTTSIFDFEKRMKMKLLTHYKDRESDFDFRRLFIGVTTISDDYDLSTTIYNDFENLEDAIDCCIASSHIPFITGGLTNKYNGRMNFDGGFKENPYLNINKSVLHVSPSMWEKIKSSIENNEGIAVRPNPSLFGSLKNFLDQTTLFRKENINFMKLFEDGYQDAEKNKFILDDIIIHKNYSTNYYYT